MTLPAEYNANRDGADIFLPPIKDNNFPSSTLTISEENVPRRWMVVSLLQNDSKCVFSFDEIQCLRKLMRELAYASALVGVST